MAPDASSVRSTERLDATIPGAFVDHGHTSLATVTTQQTSLAQALYDRRAEYTRPRHVRIKIGSWNTGAQKGTEQDVAKWFVNGKGVEEALAGLGVSDPGYHGKGDRESVAAQEARHSTSASTLPHHDAGAVPAGEDVDIYVLGLQEIVDITSPAEALRPYTDPSTANKWKASIEAALPTGYQLVAEQQLIGLYLVIYASAHVLPQIKNVSTTSVGTGLMGYMGNKGAVTTRIVLGETTRLVFINSHLAAGADKASLERRNWDAAQIESRTRFDPIVDALGSSQNTGESLGDEDFSFWFGDLNYRLHGMPGDDVRRLLTVHTKDMDEAGHARLSMSANPGDDSDHVSDDTRDSLPVPPELDPASLQTTISSLLPHDELHQMMKTGKAFHDGWEEGPIRFLPSYKYDIGKVGVFDSSEKRRCPSWCDRIIYRTRATKQHYETQLRDREAARQIDEEMKLKGTDMPGDYGVMYEYDPDTDGVTYDDYDEAEDPEPERIRTKDDLDAEILLEYYTTHMRVLSSDHKPLDAVFKLQYDAVVPELKSAVHGEIAREIDRLENEGRPCITVAVERATSSSSPDEEQNKTDSAFEGVDFGHVRFAKSSRRNITIANTGRVPATFGFADRPVDRNQPAGPFPPWLSVTFDKEPDKVDTPRPDDIHQYYTLAPADVLNIELKLKIESLDSVRDLNEENAIIDEFLVLRVENGRDHFLPIRAHWLPSVLARSIDKLIKVPEGGIRKLQHQIPARGEVKWSVPREIFRLTEAIEDLTERTLAEWDMTKDEDERTPWQDNAGWPFVTGWSDQEESEDELADIYDALDCDSLFSDAFHPETRSKERVEMLAGVLVTFLSSLTDGVITPALFQKLQEALGQRERFKPLSTFHDDDEKMAILEVLATAPNYNATFLLILSFLQNLANQIVEASTPRPDSKRASVEMPSSPQAKVRRRTLSKVPEVAIRQLIVRNYAVVFADCLLRWENGGREKDKAGRKERMVGILELFLKEAE
ncbi:inositol polyphosphate 5-phosphatase ocrl-1 [Pyrenophora seminiperda CCB06]|uniref:Inositol polyphosphate 5-phosphatase ocrl-1 n=1 Tax=Pyrenophora seminiperda CCB06 TaxID=1302712 RepID=A0A3M7MFS8_9PLEO|nr:inositol polyphosphate 5-phosphatase ocrl-1 [Pyrenophora seminiperda CCB06]